MSAPCGHGHGQEADAVRIRTRAIRPAGCGTAFVGAPPCGRFRHPCEVPVVTGGLTPEDARATADVFVWAAQRGVDSHGTARVPAYLELLAKGVANARPRITVESTTPAAAVLDADRAPGPVALTRAAREAVDRARTYGIATVGVRRTVHTGAIGYYVSRIAEQGLIGLGFVSGMPNMGYTGVKGAAVATSPLAVAVPADSRAPPCSWTWRPPPSRWAGSARRRRTAPPCRRGPRPPRTVRRRPTRTRPSCRCRSAASRARGCRSPSSCSPACWSGRPSSRRSTRTTRGGASTARTPC